MKILERRQTGRILLLYCLADDGVYYVEAEGSRFRVWRLTRDEAIAREYWARFRFWCWLIEAIPFRWFLRMATWFMRL